MENPTKMDDWGYPYFRKPPFSLRSLVTKKKHVPPLSSIHGTVLHWLGFNGQRFLLAGWLGLVLRKNPINVNSIWTQNLELNATRPTEPYFTVHIISSFRFQKTVKLSQEPLWFPHSIPGIHIRRPHFCVPCAAW